MSIFNNRIIRVLIISIIAISVIIWISVSLSYQYDLNTKSSYLNYATLSQFLSGIGALMAVMIALFIGKINNYFEKTNILINKNPYDFNFDFNGNESVRFYLHLKVSNINYHIPVNNLSLFLEPLNLDKIILDIPRPFLFAGTNIIEKDVRYDDFIDLAFIDIDFSSHHSAILNLSVVNYKAVTIDLLKNKTISFFLLSYSSSINKPLKHKIVISIKINKLEDFIKECQEIRDEYIKVNGKANEIWSIRDKFEFKNFYNYIEIKFQSI